MKTYTEKGEWLLSEAALFLGGKGIKYDSLDHGDCRTICPRCGVKRLILHRDCAWGYCIGGMECFAEAHTKKQVEKLFE